MFKQRIAESLRWSGRVGRAEYLAVGIALSVVKIFLDYLLMAHWFGRDWSWRSYLTSRFSLLASATKFTSSDRNAFLTMSLIALPFMYVGVVYCVKRLRDVGCATWPAALFFVPGLKFLLIAYLCVRPSQEPIRTVAISRRATPIGRFIPTGKAESALMGLFVSALIALPVALFITNVLGNYGWALFLGLPFFCGFSSAMIYCYHAPRTAGACRSVALASIGIIALLFLALAIEGVICLLMAAPIGIVMALMGGQLAYYLQAEHREGSFAFAVLLFALPSLAGVEHVRPADQQILRVTSVIEIDAPPATVWHNVVSFSQLDPPREAVFQAGLAYPIRAEIQGKGVGAERHCIFSTGAFVEPIQVWNEPTLLHFGVAEEPPPMVELSPFKIHPRHLDHYFSATEGEFRLVALSGGRTRLEGTTWYRLRFAPRAYWQLWSDGIVHRIHLRVLEHIKRLSETQTRAQR